MPKQDTLWPERDLPDPASEHILQKFADEIEASEAELDELLERREHRRPRTLSRPLPAKARWPG